MKHNRNPLAKAINYALGAGMIAGLAVTASPVMAQDGEAAADLDRVQVTGSRISRADIEGALPVTVIDREAIEFSGHSSVADLLRETTFNSFGSFRPQSGSSGQSWAGLSMRGLGEGRTLILLDGRRLPNAPNIGSAQDLNSIPMAAIERIEILSDGASAVYGSDAIAGVVNVVTRKDFTGAEFMYGFSEPEEDGGDTREASAVLGIAGDRGRIMMGASLNDRDIVYQNQRWWSTGGLSQYANNFLYPTGFFLDHPTNGPGVPGEGCTGPDFQINPANGQCLYDFTGDAADEAEIKNRSFFARGSYDINRDWSTYLNASVTRVQSFGRYAPVPSSPWPGGFPQLPAGTPNHPATPPSQGGLNPEWETYQQWTGEDLAFIHRFAALGPRDTNIDSQLYDVDVGVDGRFGNWDLNAGFRHTESKYYEFGENYVVGNLAQNHINNGNYNIYDPYSTPADVANAMISTTARRSEFKLRELYASVSTDLWEMAGGPVGFAVGAEYRDEIYADLYDSLSEGGEIVGSAGNSAAGGRDLTAAFVEFLFPVLDNLEIGLAGRYDDYSDYGDDFSPKISLRYQPLDNLTLRASYGEGFAAPTLDILTMKPSFSAAGIVHPATAEWQGIPEANWGQQIQVTTYQIANPNLASEQSEQFSVGAAWAPTDWLDGSLDYYNIKITDSISFSGIGTIAACLEGRTSNCPPGLSVFDPGMSYPDPSLGLGIAYGPDGEIRWAQTGYGNRGTVKTDGLDLNVRTNFDFGAAGRLENELQVGYVLGYKVNDSGNIVGEWDLPEIRAQLNNRWSFGDFSAGWNIKYIDGQDDSPTSADISTPSWTTHDVQFNWHTPWNGRLTVGATNLGNKEPPVDLAHPSGRGFSYGMYNGYGRVPYIRYTQTF